MIIYLFGVLRRFQHCTGHITTGSWKGRGNQYIEFARVVYCKLPTNGKQLPAFPLKAVTGIEPRPQRWEARVLPLCHRGPPKGDYGLTVESLVLDRIRIYKPLFKESDGGHSGRVVTLSPPTSEAGVPRQGLMGESW